MFRTIQVLLLAFFISGITSFPGNAYSKKEVKAIEKELLRKHVIKKAGNQYFLTSNVYQDQLFKDVRISEINYSDMFCLTTVQLDTVYVSFCLTNKYKYLFTFPKGSYGIHYDDGCFITRTLPISWYSSYEGATDGSGNLIFEPNYDKIIVLANNVVSIHEKSGISYVDVVNRSNMFHVSYELKIPLGLTIKEWTGSPKITAYLTYSEVDSMYPETTPRIQDRYFSLGIYYSLNCMWSEAIESFKKVNLTGDRSLINYSDFNIKQLEYLITSRNKINQCL